MNKSSSVKKNLLILIVVLVVLGLGVAAVLGYGRVKKRLEQEEQKKQQEAETTPEPTQTPTPEVTPDPSDPAVQKESLLGQIEKAIQDNNIQQVEQSLRYTGGDGAAVSYSEEDLAAVILHIKKNEADYQRFLQILQSEETTVGGEGEALYLLLNVQDIKKTVNVEEEAEAIVPEEVTPTPVPVGTGHKIAIDPGHQAHGNSEQEPIGPGASQQKAKVASGTTGRTTGVTEYELNLDVSLKLRDELTARGYEVYMTRETHDVDISNAQRAQMAADSGSDILVRIHANGSENTSVSGALTMAPSTANPYLSGEVAAQCQKLSQTVIDAFCAATGANNQGVYQTDEMSGLNWCTIPSTIVEMGYMTNPEEDTRMQTEEYQNQMVQGIANGIDQYFAS